MALQFKGDSYRSRAISQSKRNTGGVVEKTMANLMEGIMSLDDSVTKEANSLSLSFLRDIESNKKLQAEADADWATIQAHLTEFKKDESWDDAYEGWATKQFLNRGVTDSVYKEVFKNIREGNLEIITPTESETPVERVSSEEKYVSLMDRFEFAESSGNSKAKVLIKTGDQKGTYALGLFGFTNDRLEDFAKANEVEYDNASQKKVFNNKFLNSPDLQKRVMVWHLKDIEKRIRKVGFDKLVKQGATLKDGTRITMDGMIAAAHLGGFSGMTKFVRSRGTNNPTDQFGTTLKTYAQKFSGNTVDEKEESLLGSLQTYFNSSEKGKKKAIKVAMNALGMTEEEANKYLLGTISKHGTNINASNVRLRSNVEFPKTFDGILAAKAELKVKYPEFTIDDKTHVAWKRYNALDDLGKTMLNAKDDSHRREILNNPKNLADLDFDTFKQIVIKQSGDIQRNKYDSEEKYLEAVEEAMDAKGFDLAFDIYLERRKYSTSLSKMPDVGNLDNKTDYVAYELKVLQAYGVKNKDQLDQTVQDTLETIENSLSTTDPNLPKTFEAEALVQFRKDNPNATQDQILEAMTKIAMAKSVAENKDKMPTTKMEALAVLDNTTATSSQKKVAQRILNQLSTNDMKKVGGKMTYEKGGETYTKYRYDLYLKYNHQSQKNELVDAYGNVVDSDTSPATKEEIENVSKIQTTLNTENRKHKELIAVNKGFTRVLKRLTGIVEQEPDALTVGGDLASFISTGSKNITGVFDTINDLFKGRESVSVNEVEDHLRRTTSLLEGGLTLDDLLNQEVKDKASARKQFLAGAVLLIFRTGRVEGQTGQSMSNKDYDRFSSFLLKFNRDNNFFESVKAFVNTQMQTINDSALNINSDSQYLAHAQMYGGAKIEPSAPNLNAVLDADSSFKENVDYFTNLDTSPRPDVADNSQDNPTVFTGTTQAELDQFLATLPVGHFYEAGGTIRKKGSR